MCSSTLARCAPIAGENSGGLSACGRSSGIRSTSGRIPRGANLANDLDHRPIRIASPNRFG